MTTERLWQIRTSNYACGALTVGVGLLVAPIALTLYPWLSTNGVHAWPTNPWLAGLLAFIATDFMYYLQHRAEHALPSLWAFHAVHHQAELCDTSVSLRVSMFNPVLALVPNGLLAFLGVPVPVLLAVYGLHVALIFCLHSKTPRWFDRSGWVFNSPSVHRGHHSNEPRLRGKNFGGVLVIFDRLFNTWEPDCDVRSFGIGQQPTVLNPVEANLRPLRQVWRAR